MSFSLAPPSTPDHSASVETGETDEIVETILSPFSICVDAIGKDDYGVGKLIVKKFHWSRFKTIVWFIIGCGALLLKHVDDLIDNPFLGGIVHDLAYMVATPCFTYMYLYYKRTKALAHLYCKFSNDRERNDAVAHSDKTNNYKNLLKRAAEDPDTYYLAVEGRLH